MQRAQAASAEQVEGAILRCERLHRSGEARARQGERWVEAAARVDVFAGGVLGVAARQARRQAARDGGEEGAVRSADLVDDLLGRGRPHYTSDGRRRVAPAPTGGAAPRTRRRC